MKKYLLSYFYISKIIKNITLNIFEISSNVPKSKLFLLPANHIFFLSSSPFIPVLRLLSTFLMHKSIYISYIAPLIFTFPLNSQTHNSQSTARILTTSSGGRPTDPNTNIMVTNPAWGIEAAPTEASVAVKLERG